MKEGRVFHLAGGFTIDSQFGDLWEGHIQNIEGTRESVLGLPKELTNRLIFEVQNEIQ